MAYDFEMSEESHHQFNTISLHFHRLSISWVNFIIISLKQNALKSIFLVPHSFIFFIQICTLCPSIRYLKLTTLKMDFAKA